jgi:hypothetical protein
MGFPVFQVGILPRSSGGKVKKHRTKIITYKSGHAAFMVKWTCNCSASGFEPSKPDAVVAARTHREESARV